MSRMAETGEASLFRGDGQGTTGTALWFLIVFGVIGALTAGIVSFAGLRVGPWWVWLLVIVGFVWLGRWEMRRSAMVIELVEKDGELRLRITGRDVAVDEQIERGYDYWTNVVTNSVRQGGPMLRYNITVRTNGGRQIGFHTLGGRMSLDWPERREGLADGSDTFSPLNLFLLEKALRAAGTAPPGHPLRSIDRES
jgi:hypothetical protein